jgi:tRNA (cytidine32/guanosine34-2'-O)-methyltransferase
VHFADDVVNLLEGPNRAIIPFVACGDLSGFDSDRTYPLQLKTLSDDFKDWEYQCRDVVQPPTEPAYKKATALKKNCNLEKDQITEGTKNVKKKKQVESGNTNSGITVKNDEQIDLEMDCLLMFSDK